MKIQYNLDEIHTVAEKILSLLFQKAPKKWILLLTGELGAGKTTFAREIIKKIIPDVGHVQSPTFPIMIPYEYDGGRLVHMDFYRLNHDGGASETLLKNDIIDALHECICIIEWPEMSPVVLSQYHDVFCVNITIEGDETRMLSLC